MDQELFGQMIKVENKDIFVDLRQNSSGVYLKLSERNGKNRNTVLIPASGISRLKAVLDEVQSISLKNTRISHERKNRVASDPAVVNRSVYVSGLAWSTTDEELKAHFERVAPVTSAVVLKRHRGGKSVSLGCGVVEFGSPEVATMAVQQLHDTELDGRTIKCREDRSVDNGDDEAGTASDLRVQGVAAPTPGIGGSAQRVRDPHKVFVTSLSWETTGEDLQTLFGQIGEVVSAEVLMTKKGRSLGHGVVHFADPACAQAAVERLDHTFLGGREITVREFYVA
jgi:RNA recognition motif-containing protein